MRNRNSTFIEGGQFRAAKAAWPILRKQVEEEFTPLRPNSGWFGKVVFRWRVDREIKRRIRCLASDRSLY